MGGQRIVTVSKLFTYIDENDDFDHLLIFCVRLLVGYSMPSTYHLHNVYQNATATEGGKNGPSGANKLDNTIQKAVNDNVKILTDF